MNTKKQPLLILLVGSNGAGKTTFYQLYLKHLQLPFINADQLAAERWPDGPVDAEQSYEAARMASALRHEHIEQRKSFVSETVFSHPSKLELLRKAKAAGFRTRVIYVHLNNADLAVTRVQQRVQRGGHPVPEKKIKARFLRLKRHLRIAGTIADAVYLYDNSGSGKAGENHLYLGKVKRGQVVERARQWPDSVEQLFSAP